MYQIICINEITSLSNLFTLFIVIHLVYKCFILIDYIQQKSEQLGFIPRHLLLFSIFGYHIFIKMSQNSYLTKALNLIDYNMYRKTVNLN